MPQKFLLKKNSSGTVRQQQSFGGYQQNSVSNKQAKKNKTKKETLFNMSLAHVIPTGELENAHPLIGKLISAREVPKLPLPKLKHFLET